MRPTPLAAAALSLALLASACGSSDSTGSATTAANGKARTVQIEMRDIAYAPTSVSVKAGETVRFVFTNVGTGPHDAFLGDAAAQDDHEMEMRDMGHHSKSNPDAVSVAPGKTGELTRTFAAGDQVIIGCHEAGHYKAGMHLAVDVT